MVDAMPLKVAESPAKADLLKLLDELRAEIEGGDCVALVVIPIFTEMAFSVRSKGDISMTRLAGLLGRAWMDATQALRE